MKCLKCGHVLPDDSVFCQYCGANIEHSPAEPFAKPDEVAEEETSVASALAEILTVQITEGRKAVVANQGIANKNIFDPEYGFVPEKPIYTTGVDGEKQYLQSLRTVAGSPVTWNRRGSMSAEGVHGLIDIYDVFLPSGDLYRTLYINMYSDTNSSHAPVGFYIATKANNGPSMEVESVKKSDSAKRAVERIKKTKGPKNTRVIMLCFLTAVMTAVLVVVLCQGYVRKQNADQLTQIAELQGKIDELEATVALRDRTINIQKKTIENYKKSSEENRENLSKARFFDMYAEIVPDDGTRTYHKWGCSKLDTSEGFWIYNTAAAEDDYKKCSFCH